MPRLVSLVPSVTETLAALGSPPVACTRFCHRRGVPAVGGTKNPDLRAIARLAPDAVIVNDEENRLEDAEALEAMGIPTISVSPRSVEDAGPAVVAVAGAAEVSPPDAFGEAQWKQWVEQQRRPGVGGRVFVPIWTRPWMTLNASTYGSSLLDLLGLENVSARATTRYPEVDLDDVRALGPDLVLLPTEPYPFRSQHVSRARDAFPGATVSLVDGEDLFWWGTRTPHAIRRLTHFLASL